MKLKIIPKNKNTLKATLKEILDIACVVCSKAIPEERHIKEPQRLGKYWYRQDNKIHLWPIANNHWAYITEETDESLFLEFKFRYDFQRKQEEALVRLIEVFFQDEIAVYL